MNIKRFAEIKHQMQSSKEYSKRILNGDAEYVDGSVLAKDIERLCQSIQELLNSFIPEE